MPTKMRLQRFGKKGQPYYHIVIADGRAPRDGRFTEKIGTYNPLSRPADINLDFDRALYWVRTGAQPTETVAAILKYTGVAYMHHLLKGVDKGAMTNDQALAKFEDWKAGKTAKIESAKKDILLKGKSADKKKLEAEAKINEAKADELAKKRAAAAGLDAKAQRELAAEVADEEVTTEVSPEKEVVAEVAAPEVVAAEVAAPEVAATEEAAPEVAAAEEATPEVAAAEEAAPEVAAAEETTPEATAAEEEQA